MRTQTLNSAPSSLSLISARLVRTHAAETHAAAKTGAVEETLVVDERAARRPAQAVEDKLSRALQSGCIGVSQLRLKNLLSARAKRA